MGKPGGEIFSLRLLLPAAGPAARSGETDRRSCPGKALRVFRKIANKKDTAESRRISADFLFLSGYRSFMASFIRSGTNCPKRRSMASLVTSQVRPDFLRSPPLMRADI